MQTAVARQLQLGQRLVPLTEAAGPGGLLQAALDLSAGWPQPMWNIWSPAYMHLARVARTAGARVVLTGRGGDEWLTVTPYLMADLALRGDAAGIWRMLQTWRRSHPAGRRGDSARLLWRHGRTAGRQRRARRHRTGAVERAPASAPARASGPIGWRPTRRFARRWTAASIDGSIRRGRHMASTCGKCGLPCSTRASRTIWRRRRSSGAGTASACCIRSGTWIWSTPSTACRRSCLMRDGRSKWLLRRRLEARLPGLGLERRTKVSAGGVFTGMMAREARPAWERLGGLSTLAEAGVVSEAGVEAAGHSLAELERLGAGRLWALLTLESWAKHRR